MPRRFTCSFLPPINCGFLYAFKQEKLCPASCRERWRASASATWWSCWMKSRWWVDQLLPFHFGLTLLVGHCQSRIETWQLNDFRNGIRNFPRLPVRASRRSFRAPVRLKNAAFKVAFPVNALAPLPCYSLDQTRFISHKTTVNLQCKLIFWLILSLTPFDFENFGSKCSSRRPQYNKNSSDRKTPWVYRVRPEKSVLTELWSVLLPVNQSINRRSPCKHTRPAKCQASQCLIDWLVDWLISRIRLWSSFDCLIW